MKYDSLYKRKETPIDEETTMARFDPHYHERYYQNWRDRGSPLDGITEANKQSILQYLEDMEIGANVNPGSKRGARSFGRLRNLKAKIQTMLHLMEKEMNIKSLVDLENKDIETLRLFKKVRDGQIKCRSTQTKPLMAMK